MNEKTITLEELMTALNIGRNTAYELVHSESFFPAFRIGRKILINVDKLDDWLEQQRMTEE